jgi:hypothetical protein
MGGAYFVLTTEKQNSSFEVTKRMYKIALIPPKVFLHLQGQFTLSHDLTAIINSYEE